MQILRPIGFEYVAELEEEVCKAAPKNVKAISKDLPFVDFTRIEFYATKHSRAARSFASIRGQRTKGIDPARLQKACEHFNVKTKTVNGRLVVDQGSIMDFLHLTDRRLYQFELVRDSPESYLAASRTESRSLEHDAYKRWARSASFPVRNASRCRDTVAPTFSLAQSPSLRRER